MEIVADLVNEVFEVAFSIVYTQYLEAQSFPYTVQEAKRSLLQVIEVHTRWLLQPLIIQFLKKRGITVHLDSDKVLQVFCVMFCSLGSSKVHFV